MRREVREEAVRAVLKRREGRRRGKGKKGKVVDDVQEEEGIAEEDVEMEMAEALDVPPDEADDLLIEPASAADEEDPLVISNLTSFTLSSGKVVLMWSAVGFVQSSPSSLFGHID